LVQLLVGPCNLPLLSLSGTLNFNNVSCILRRHENQYNDTQHIDIHIRNDI
jgi:hypothetical protein